MASSASISETQDSEISGSQSSSQYEASARSELMEEAKRKANILIKLYPRFEFKVKRFPEKVRKQNEDIFNGWKGLFNSVDKCTNWVPLLKNQLNLRLQNLPGEDGMFQVVPRMVFFTQFYRNGYVQPAIRQVLNAN